MAFSAHKDADSIKEHFDDEATLDHKTDVLVQMIKASKHFVAFTGAGISTSAGIPGTFHLNDVHAYRDTLQFLACQTIRLLSN